PDTAGLDAERADVVLERGAVRVNARLETTAPGIWAAGDVTGGLQFTHVADYMARLVVRNALTPLKAAASYRIVPWVTYTDPEVARVGLTEAEATARGERVEVFGAEFADRDWVDASHRDHAPHDQRAAHAPLERDADNAAGRADHDLGATIVGRGAGEL